MFEQILAALAALQTQVVELQANALIREQAKYDEGYAAGLAASGNGGIYSQEQLDAAVAAAVNPLKDEIAALKLEVDALKAAALQYKADLKAAYEAQQVAETEGETGFKNLLG
jgi:hypothetical protein